MTEYHIPVLFNESIDALVTNPDGIYIDATFGGGGHSRGILQRLSSEGYLYGFDQDLDALNNVPEEEEEGDRFTFVRGNFRYVSNFMDYYDEQEIDGILADIGVSSHHFDEADRGFSFRFDAEPDMRMNQQQRLSAKEVINTYSEEELADVFYLYGELRQSRRLASLIALQRKEKRITTMAELIECIRPALNKKIEKKELSQLFQALRIEVNDELGALKELLTYGTELLVPGGRMAIITYHSLEDRIVKNFFKTGNFEGEVKKDFYGNLLSPFELLKPITPSNEEIERNPRSRSARLRVAIKR